MASKTLIKGGVIHDGKGKQFTTLQDALANDTKCGCGINCKEGFIALPNFNSESGDIDGFYALYIVNGEITVDTVENAKAEIKSFCNNAFVSATSVTLSGCPSSAVSEGASPIQLTATVNPTGALQTGTWSSSDTGVVTVSSSGLVTVVAAGSATVTFTSTDGGFTATCSILVVSAG
jgi:uncharacterized protein YjdB